MEKRNYKSNPIKIGDEFFDLTVIEFSGLGIASRPMWKCKCICGKEIVTFSRYLSRGSKKDCGCKLNTKEKYGNRRLPSGESLRNRVAESYINNSKRKNIKFELTKEIMYDMFKKTCYFCGREPYHTISNDKHYGSFTYNGIDRLNPINGYVKENVVTCCQQCNYMKNSYSKEEFLNLITMIYKNFIS